MWSDLRIRVVLVLGFAATTISGRDNGPMHSGLQMERKDLETVWEPFLASNHCSCILLESSAQIWLGDSEWYGHRMIFEREDGTRLQGSFLYHLENPSQDGTWENVRLFTLKRKFYWHSETGWTCDRQQVGRQLTIQEWFMIPTLNIEPGRPWTEQPVREGYLKPITNVSSLRWNELRELLEVNPAWFEEQAKRNPQEAWAEVLCQVLSMYSVKDRNGAEEAAKRMKAAGLNATKIDEALE